MDLDEKALLKLAEEINRAIDYKLKGAKFDRSYVAQVMAKEPNYRYTVAFAGQTISAKGYPSADFNIGDFVVITVPQNNISNTFIIPKTGSYKDPSDAQANHTHSNKAVLDRITNKMVDDVEALKALAFKDEVSIGDLDESLTASVNSIANKVDTTTYQQGIASKADKTYVDQQVGAKADKTYVDQQLLAKADTVYVNQQLGTKANLSDLSNKVDKVAGKGLSTNDYTNEDKDLVDTIPEKADKTIATSATLLSSGWVGDTSPYTQSISVSGITSDSSQVVEVGGAENLTKEQYSAMVSAQLWAKSKQEGSITVEAKGEKPSVDLPVLVVIYG